MYTEDQADSSPAAKGLFRACPAITGSSRGRPSSPSGSPRAASVRFFSTTTRSTDGSAAIRLEDGEPLAIAPDGDWVSTNDRKADKLVLLPTGAGEAKPVLLGNIEISDTTFVPKSRLLAVRGVRPGGGGERLFLTDWEGGDVRAFGPADIVGAPTFSPDGKKAVIKSAKLGALM